MTTEGRPESAFRAINKLPVATTGPVVVVPPFRSRRDLGEVKIPEMWRALTEQGTSIVCDEFGRRSFVAIASTPHTCATTPAAEFAADLAAQFGSSPPTLEGRSEAPTHLVIWYGDREDDEVLDLRRAAKLPQDEQGTLYNLIASQTARSVAALTGKVPSIDIWGTTGSSQPHEREESGRSAGGPSNPHGHHHVTSFASLYDEAIQDQPLPLHEQVKLNAVWNWLMHKHFSEPIARAVAHTLSEVPSKAANAMVEPLYKEQERDNGYTITFAEDVTFQDMFGALAVLYDRFDTFYQNVTELHSSHRYRKNLRDKRFAVFAQDLIGDLAMELMFTAEEAHNFAHLICSIPQTFSQRAARKLTPDAVEALQHHRRRVRDRLKKKGVNTLLGQIMLDTTAFIDKTDPTTYAEPSSVWPEHFSFLWVVKDFKTADNGALLVKSLEIYPALGTTKGGIENVTGLAARRAATTEENQSIN